MEAELISYWSAVVMASLVIHSPGPDVIVEAEEESRTKQDYQVILPCTEHNWFLSRSSQMHNYKPVCAYISTTSISLRND